MLIREALPPPRGGIDPASYQRATGASVLGQSKPGTPYRSSATAETRSSSPRRVSGSPLGRDSGGPGLKVCSGDGSWSHGDEWAGPRGPIKGDS